MAESEPEQKAEADPKAEAKKTEPSGKTEPTSRTTQIMPGGWFILVILAAIAIAFILLEPKRTVSYSPQFRKLVEGGELERLTIIGGERAEGKLRDPESENAKEMKITGGKFRVHLPRTENQNELIRYIEENDKKARDRYQPKEDEKPPEPIIVKLEEEPFGLIGPLIWFMIPLLIFLAFFVFFILPRLRDPMGGGFLNNYVRSPAKKYDKSKTQVTFRDVAGMENSKLELTEVVDFLKSPERFARVGAQVPKGVLLVGPPGTGKTLLAKAVAGEANVPFYSINGSEFIQMFVGVGASRVRDLFQTAKENAPCVIFIDEIDAVGRMRGAGVGGGSDEREQTLNQILSEMDGFQPSETVIVVAATNRPDVLDAALLRPGRFDRHVTVDRPTWQGRLSILKVHTRNKPLADEVDLERVARNMIGMSGADLRNLCNEAALHATRQSRTVIAQDDFDAAADRLRLGAPREEPFSDEEKRRTAYHESGHALCAWLEPKAHKLDRVSIVPRGQAGGVTLFRPDEDRVDRSYQEFMADLVVTLGGRAADLIVLGEPLSGAVQDIRQATRIARLMVTQFGMSERLGPVHFRQAEEHVFLGKEIHEGRDFSEGTASVIDEEIRRIILEALSRAENLLRSHRAELDLLATTLIAQEELDAEAIDRLLKKPDAVTPAPAGSVEA